MSSIEKMFCSVLLWTILCNQLETRVLYLQNYENGNSHLPQLQLSKLETPSRVVYTQPRSVVSIARPVKLVSRDVNFVSNGVRLAAENTYSSLVGVRPVSVLRTLFGGHSETTPVILVRTAIPEKRNVVVSKKLSARCLECPERTPKCEQLIEKQNKRHKVHTDKSISDNTAGKYSKNLKTKKSNSKTHRNPKDQRQKVVPAKGTKSENNNVKSKPKLASKRQDKRVRSEETDDDSDEKQKPTKSKIDKERKSKPDSKGKKNNNSYEENNRLPVSVNKLDVQKEVKKDGQTKVIPSKSNKSEPIKKPVGNKEKPTLNEGNDDDDDDDLESNQDSEPNDDDTGKNIKVYKLKEPIGYEYGFDDILESYEVSDDSETDN